VFTILFEHSAALIGLVIALMGIALAEILEMPRLDGIASLGIGVVLAATAAFLAFESRKALSSSTCRATASGDCAQAPTALRRLAGRGLRRPPRRRADHRGKHGGSLGCWIACVRNGSPIGSEAAMSTQRPASNIAIRPCTEADIAAITGIYAHHVLHGLASFESDSTLTARNQHSIEPNCDRPRCRCSR
jgi:hypothetical protein